MAEKYGEPESDEQRSTREAEEYWARVRDGAKSGDVGERLEQNKPRAKQTAITNTSPPGLDPDETDPLVIITAALRANAEAVKEGTKQAEATTLEVTASNRRIEQRLETLKKQIQDNTAVFGNFIANEQRIADAEAAKFFWAVGSFVAGLLVFGVGQTLWLRFFG